ncbi:MAG TPA: cyclase family protein [Steroidobacteraceae bacterium]|jgi:kynurenine formamidase|nr:cyclase family protein [Steroidobacteraceae bacterium]
MSKSTPVSRRALLGSTLLLAGGPPARAQARGDTSLWDFYRKTLRRAKYIDLTHAIAPGGPIGEGFADFKVGAARAGVSIPGVIRKGEPFNYATLGVAITAYDLPMDHIGTQFGPPAHMNEHGATISDIPPTVALRPLVVVNVASKVAVDPGYQATVNDVKEWERRHGPIPAGSVAMIRSDWSQKWHDPQRFTRAPFPGVTLAALQYLHLERHVLMHGHEPLDTDDTAPRFVGESWLLKHNFAQAEGVAHLDRVPESGALIAIGFAKFAGGTGGFARYIAIAPPEWPHGTTIAEAPGAPLPTRRRALRRGRDGVLS